MEEVAAFEHSSLVALLEFQSVWRPKVVQADFRLYSFQESELTSFTSVSDYKYQRRQRREADDPHTASAPLILPNPYVSSPTLTRFWNNKSHFISLWSK